MIWLNILILILAILAALAALISLASALFMRNSIANQPYGVGRQESRRTMLVTFIRAAIIGIVALILFAVYGLSARPDEMLTSDPEPTAELQPTQALEASDATVTATQAPTMTAVSVTLPPAITSAAPTTTASPTETPTITPTPVPSAIVNSEVGLYLRPEPGSTVELELLNNGAFLELLEGRETIDGVEWQQVRSATGSEGWVSVEFITYQ